VSALALRNGYSSNFLAAINVIEVSLVSIGFVEWVLCWAERSKVPASDTVITSIDGDESIFGYSARAD